MFLLRHKSKACKPPIKKKKYALQLPDAAKKRYLKDIEDERALAKQGGVKKIIPNVIKNEAGDKDMDSDYE